jgi:hypothetical protein
MIYFLILFLVGCGNPTEKPASTKATIPAELSGKSADKTLPSADFRLKPQPEPGVYELEIEWDTASVLVDEVWIEKETKGHPREYIFRSQEAKGSYTDKSLQFGKNYGYQVFATSEGRSFPLGAMALSLPEDWVVPAGEHAWVQRPLGRLFLSKGSVVRLEKKDMALELLELHSAGGTIETYQTGEAAPEATAGRSGGRIQIRAGFATGTVTLASRGESGGPGLNGQNGKPGNPGADALPEVRFYDGHAHGHSNMQSRMALPKEMFTHVTIPRTPATDGQNGEPGAPGTNGGDGGSSGGVLLKVDKAGSFLPIIVSQGGSGGSGGRGGVGGAGGEGGIVRDLPPSPHPLIGGKRGIPGENGCDGTAGKKGADGPTEVVLQGNKVL